jgi:AcrR family transcriptional regulator
VILAAVPRRSRSRGGSRAAILSAAARAIARDGYHGMSMRDLARATGLGLGSSYAHFASKEDILYALQSEAFDALIDGAERALAGERDPSLRLYAFILNHLRFFTAHPDVMRVLVAEAGALPAKKRAAIRERKERYFALARGVLEVVIEFGCGRGGACPRTQGDDEVERATYALFGMLNWVYGWYEPRRHGPPEALAATFHRITLCGAVASCPFREDYLAVPQVASATGGAS